MALCALYRGRLAGAQLAVNFQQAFFLVFSRILCQSCQHTGILTKGIQNLLFTAQTKGTHQNCYRDFAVLINTNIKYIVGICFKLQPCATVGVQGCAEKILSDFVLCATKINTGAANQLGNNYTLSTIIQEGTRIGHQWEITHKNLLVLYLTGFLVQQSCFYTQGSSISGVPLLALLNGVLGLGVQAIVDELQNQVAGIVLNGRDVTKHLFQTLIQKPLVRIFLHLNEVGHLNNLINAGKAHALGFSELYGLDLHHKKRPLLFIYFHISLQTAQKYSVQGVFF